MTPAFEMFNASDPANGVTIPEGTVLLGYRGSIAHGMYCDPVDPKGIDDVDLMGCVIGGPQHYFGLHEWGSRGTKEIKRGRYDCVFYEIRKLVSLLLQGNPNVLSLLWMKPEHYIHVDPAGRALIDNRNLFVGRHVYNAFAGYAHAQMEKMELRDPDDLRQYIALTSEAKFRGIHPNHKGEMFAEPVRDTGELRDVKNWADDRVLAGIASYAKKGDNIGYLGEKRKKLVLANGWDTKNGAHLIRLLRMCREFMETGEVTVFRPDGAELIDIKRGKWTLDQVKEHAAELFDACRKARDESALPAEPDYAGAENLLIGILKERFA